MNSDIALDESLARYDVSKGMYVLHNGVEFKTLDEVKAFIKGAQFSRDNANIGMESFIKNTINSLKSIEL